MLKDPFRDPLGTKKLTKKQQQQREKAGLLRQKKYEALQKKKAEKHKLWELDQIRRKRDRYEQGKDLSYWGGKRQYKGKV